MANNPKKVKDPTEVALSAIQEALNISDTNVDHQSKFARQRTRPQTSPSGSAALFRYRRLTRAEALSGRCSIRIEEPRGPRRAANDDRETIGQILQAIQKGSPARSVYTLASVFGGVWVIGCGLLTVSFLPALQAAIGQSGGVLVLGRPCRVVLCAGAVVLFPREPRLARPGNADDRAVDGAGRDPLLRARGRRRRSDGDRRASDLPRSRRDGRRRRARDRARRRTGNAGRQ